MVDGIKKSVRRRTEEPAVADVRWDVEVWWLRRICNPPQLSMRICNPHNYYL